MVDPLSAPLATFPTRTVGVYCKLVLPPTPDFSFAPGPTTMGLLGASLCVLSMCGPRARGEDDRIPVTQTTWSDGSLSGRAAPGTTIGGRYALRAAVGNGGMGTVWRASDTLLRREVAVKEVVLPPGLAPSDRDAMYERTMREARAAAALSHPAVVQVYDVVTEGGRPWIVMELLDARSLADIVIEDGPLAPRAVAKIGIALLGALEVAHAAGVLHRDVKPANVLICADGRCVLTDFGVARMPTDVQLTTPGMVLGSPHFISPERAMGGPFGPPSDLFSLGVTLYTAVEGHPPFDKGDPIETMHAVVEDPPIPPVRAGTLAAILFGLLEKDPAKRWDVQAARTSLRELLTGPLASASPQFVTDPYAVVPNQRPGQDPAPATQPVAPTGQIGGRAMLAPGESLADRIAQRSSGTPSGPTVTGDQAASSISTPTSGYPAPAPASSSPGGSPAPATQMLPPAGQGLPPDVQGFPAATQALPPAVRGMPQAPQAFPASPAAPGGWQPQQQFGGFQPPPGQGLAPGQGWPSAQGWQPGQPPAGTLNRTGSGMAGKIKAWSGRTRLLAVGGLAVVVLAVTLVVLNMGGDSPKKTPVAVQSNQPSPTAQPSFPVEAYDDRGIVVNVPAGWDKSSAGSWVDFVDPGGAGRKVRILVEAAGTDPVKFMKTAESGLEKPKSSCIKPYKRVALRDNVQLAGQTAAELEYTCGEGDQARHGIWRAVLRDHKAYEFYLTVPESRFAESKPIFDEMVRSFKLNPT